MYQTIAEAVLGHARECPEKPALCFKGQEVTYGELAGTVRALAGILEKRHGIGPGDVVMVRAVSRPEFVAAHLAVQYLGGTVVPADKSALPESLSSLCRFVGPKLLLADGVSGELSSPVASLRDICEEARRAAAAGDCGTPYASPDPDSLAEVIFTTGTTGEPKGAMLTYRAILSGTMHTRDGVRREPEDVELLPLPLHHSFGLRVLRTALYIGATVVLQNGFLFSKELEGNIRDRGCTGIAIVPASVEQLWRSMGPRFSEVFGRLRHMEVGAGSLSVGMKERLLSSIPNVRLYNVWGSSETGGVIFLDVTAHPDRAASIGIPAPDVEVAMRGADGSLVVARAPEEAGRMVMRGEMQMSGYYKRPDLTAEAIVDGYLQTGDLAYLDGDGFVYMLGRADDIINVGGEKVSPVEVENAASLMDGVAECACVGADDLEGVFGQIPVLFFVPEGAPIGEEAISRFLSERLEQYKLPKKYVALARLPRNKMQKIDRRRLREMLASGDAAASAGSASGASAAGASAASGASKDAPAVAGSQAAGAQAAGNPVVAAIMGRRSVRDFTEEEVSREDLEQIARCGIMAPCGHNLQTWRFTIVRRREVIASLRGALEAAGARKGEKVYGFRNPAALILATCDRRNRDGNSNCACAAENMMLAAHSLGIGSVWINALGKLCDEPEVREILRGCGVPDSHAAWAMLALGHPAAIPPAPARREDAIAWVE